MPCCAQITAAWLTPRYVENNLWADNKPQGRWIMFNSSQPGSEETEAIMSAGSSSNNMSDAQVMLVQTQL